MLLTDHKTDFVHILFYYKVNIGAFQKSIRKEKPISETGLG